MTIKRRTNGVCRRAAVPTQRERYAMKLAVLAGALDYLAARIEGGQDAYFGIRKKKVYFNPDAPDRIRNLVKVVKTGKAESGD